jgi:hypothetical protein
MVPSFSASLSAPYRLTPPPLSLHKHHLFIITTSSFISWLPISPSARPCPQQSSHRPLLSPSHVYTYPAPHPATPPSLLCVPRLPHVIASHACSTSCRACHCRLCFGCLLLPSLPRSSTPTSSIPSDIQVTIQNTPSGITEACACLSLSLVPVFPSRNPLPRSISASRS